MTHEQPLPAAGVRSLAAKRAGWAVAAGALFFLLPSLGEGSLFDSDDAIYAQMAREARAAGDLVDNRWCGVVQFEKPPLLIAALAGLTALLGEAEWVLRLPAVFAFVICLTALFWLAVGLGRSPMEAVVAAVLMGTTALAVLSARRVMTDLPMLAGLLTAAAAAVHGRAGLTGLGLGLAGLAKGVAAGPLGLLALVVLWRTAGPRRAATALGVAIAVVAPWVIAITWRHGAAAWEGLVGYHAVSRATANVVPGLSAGQLLALLAEEWVLVCAGVAGFAVSLSRRTADGAASFASATFALAWLVVALAPVLLSSTRLMHYLLPALPALALLAAGLPRPRLLAPALGVLALAAGPGTLAYWLEPDFGPHTKRAGRTIAAAAGEAPVVAWNLTDQALTWYAGRCVPMVATDPVFRQVQEAVLMNQRAGVVLHEAPRGAWLVASRDGSEPPHANLSALSFGSQLVVLNPAGLGPAASPWPPPLEEAR